LGFAQTVYKVFWIYSYFTLALISAVALVPSYFLFQWANGATRLAGLTLQGPGTPWYGTLVHAFLVCFGITGGFFLFGISLILAVAIVRILMGLRSKEDEIPIPSMRLWNWYHYDGLLLFVGNVFGPFLRSMSLFNVYVRLMGGKVGKNVIINTNKIYDHDLLEIGDNTIIGGDVVIIAHVAEARKLVRRRVKIGKNVTIGQLTSIFPGAQIGDNVTIGAHTLVPKNAIIPSDTVWGGVPAHQLAKKK
jgi:acetyltransferase-like isoleucine patch superfamily enzyme